MEEIDPENKETASKPNPQSFIIRFFFERASEDSSLIEWRGQIRHVPSGRSQYFRTLTGILEFIAPYLEQMGVKLDKPSWWTSWWRR